MLQPNFHFEGRYNLLRLLGRGGFSEVWLAEDLMANVQVAIKVYSPGQGLDDEGIEMFRKEFALVADMNHTNLLRPTFYGYWQRMPYLVLPYCENGSLENYINNGKRISEEEAWRIIRDVASGLAYLHNHKPPVVHQDIKPGNILIGMNGPEECYMITDFGISAKMRNTVGADRKAFSSGTIAYMGPERFGENAASVKASDIWSLGATLCELMTGDVPFGESGGQAQSGGVTLMDFPGNYSGQLVQVIKKCLDPEPWNRPDAQTLAEEADSHITGKKNLNKIFKIAMALLAVAAVAIGGLVIRNRIKEKERIEMERIEMARNDSLSTQCIENALDYVLEGDALLENSIDKHFEEAYLNAFNELESIESNFGNKVSLPVLTRAAKVDSIVTLKLLEAKDTLVRKSLEVKEMGIESLNAFADGLLDRVSLIDSHLNNN